MKKAHDKTRWHLLFRNKKWTVGGTTVIAHDKGQLPELTQRKLQKMDDYLQCMMEIREELSVKNEKEYVKNPLKYKLTPKVSNSDLVTYFKLGIGGSGRRCLPLFVG